MTPAAEAEALFALAPVAPDHSWRYGPHPSQVVDYHGTAGPRLTVLHGGFWREAYDRSHLSATAAALAGAGFSVALAEYRRVGGGGGWPGTFDDVARVVAAAWPDDGEGQLLFGHSAGGHLALWAAGRDPDQVRGVVVLAPVADLEYARRLGLGDGAVDAMLGDTGKLDEVDPMRMPPAARPAVILHGDADPDVPIEVSRRYAAASGAELRELAGTGHFGPLIPGSAGFAVLLAALRGRR